MTRSDKLQALRGDVASIAKQLDDIGQDTFNTVSTRVRARLHDGATHVRHRACQAGELVRDGADAVAKRVEERPHQTAVGALLVGLVLGAIVGRSSRE